MLDQKMTLSRGYYALIASLLFIAIVILEVARDDSNAQLLLGLAGVSTLLMGVALVLISGTLVVSGVKYTDDNQWVRVSMILGGVYVLIEFVSLFSLQGLIEMLDFNW